MTEVTVRIDIEDAVETALGDIDVSDYIDITFADEDEFQSLSSEVQELQAQMTKLLEVINLPADPYETITHARLEDVRDIYMARRDERYQTIRYMSKPELVEWAVENGYCVNGRQGFLTVKEIHEMIL